jgi:hypothetical protein
MAVQFLANNKGENHQLFFSNSSNKQALVLKGNISNQQKSFQQFVFDSLRRLRKEFSCV